MVLKLTPENSVTRLVLVLFVCVSVKRCIVLGRMIDMMNVEVAHICLDPASAIKSMISKFNKDLVKMVDTVQ